MLCGTLDDLSPIARLGGNFPAALAFLQKVDINGLSPQRYEIDGANVFATFYDADLQEPCCLLFETHTHYADIQLITDGCEGMRHTSISAGLTVHTPYDEDRDITFYEEPAVSTELAIMPKQFVVFFPDDAHKPGCKTPNSNHSCKLVIKVKVD